DPFLRETSSAEAPWLVVPGADARFRALTIGRHLLAAISTRLSEKPVPVKRASDKAQLLPASGDRLNVLRTLELDQPMTTGEYKSELEKWQGHLNLASRDPRFKSMSVVAVFEGNDGAGKGGAIRRVTGALDSRCYSNVSVA